MIVTDPASMEVTDALAILGFGLIAFIFSFVPIILILIREYNKYGVNDKEIFSGHSNFTFLIIILISLPVMWILYLVFTFMFQIVFPDISPISGPSGITRIFWTIQAPTEAGSTFEKNWVLFFLNGIEIVRKVFGLISLGVIMMIAFYGFKMSFELIAAFKNDARSGQISIVSTLFKALIGLLITWFTLVYYNVNTEDIINHPDGGIWDVGTKWISKGVDDAISGVNSALSGRQTGNGFI